MITTNDLRRASDIVREAGERFERAERGAFIQKSDDSKKILRVDPIGALFLWFKLGPFERLILTGEEVKLVDNKTEASILGTIYANGQGINMGEHVRYDNDGYPVVTDLTELLMVWHDDKGLPLSAIADKILDLKPV